MKRLFAVAALATAAVVLTGSSTLDYVRTANCGGYETGFFVWGAIPGANLPTWAKGGCGADVSVGAVGTDTGGGNQLAAFTSGKAPQLLPSVDWNSNATRLVTFTPAAQVKVKFWVLYLPKDCDLDCTQKWVSGFLAWANALLFRERAGIELAAADEAAVVSDQTGNNDATVDQFRWVSETKDCKEKELAELKAVLYQDQALNVYLVNKVGNSASRGTVCQFPPPVRDTAFVAHEASYGTMLHEIGHLFGLQHADYVDGMDETNLMHSASDVRNYVTEGQVFWMHFADRSALPVELGGRQDLMRNCYGNIKPDKPCPAWKVWIWQDH